MTEGRSADARVRAAKYVTRGEWEFNNTHIPAYSEEERRRAREAMFGFWRNALDINAIGGGYAPGELPELLATWTATDLSLLQNLREGYARHSLELRRVVMHVLVNEMKPPSRDALAAHGVALEDFLGEQLDDLDYTYHIAHGKTINAQGRTARMADLAAELLHRIWPDRYAFTWDATPGKIEEARKECLREWRRARGLMPTQSGTRAPLSRSEPTAVTKITLAKGSQPLSPDLQAQADIMIGRPLNSHAVVQLLADFAAGHPDDAQSIRLTAKRGAKASGIVVEIMIQSAGPVSTKANCQVDVNVSGKDPWSIPVKMDRKAAMNPESRPYESFKWMVEDALRSSSEGAVYFQFVRRGEP